MRTSKVLSALALCAALVACGVDGPPEPPAGAAPGISFGGTVQVGIAKDGG